MRLRTKILLTILLGLGLITGTAVACNDSSPVSFFPVQESGFDQMDGDFGGELELVAGCLRVTSSDNSYLAIWPYGFSVRVRGGEIQVLDADGEVVGRVGDTIEVGGGGTTLEIVEKYIGDSLPEGCEGPYWLVAGVIDS